MKDGPSKSLTVDSPYDVEKILSTYYTSKVKTCTFRLVTYDKDSYLNFLMKDIFGRKAGTSMIPEEAKKLRDMLLEIYPL